MGGGGRRRRGNPGVPSSGEPEAATLDAQDKPPVDREEFEAP